MDEYFKVDDEWSIFILKLLNINNCKKLLEIKII